MLRVTYILDMLENLIGVDFIKIFRTSMRILRCFTPVNNSLLEPLPRVHNWRRIDENRLQLHKSVQGKTRVGINKEKRQV
mmetsp:Transcript_2607/g.8376  ORF Transcript_2607/g.8376 Transcript_2607/m.8376 type:complete len:80 (+) Transcript_2607:1059-1298(+)